MLHVPFGRYVLKEKLAIGGMAEIYVAQSVGAAGFSKTCVIKRVLPHLAVDPSFLEMFLDEARLAARLSHPHIAQIYDLGHHEAEYYLVMEYLAGEDVAEILARGGALPVEIASKVIADAASALHYAHELRDERERPLGIIHRDVSPANLLLTYQGAVKLLDFGIARAASRRHKTEQGDLKGKLPYMAPEQLTGEPIDRRVDVWGLGVCLHEMLTGQRLFRESSPGAQVRAICDARIPLPGEVRPGIPPALDGIVARALARDAAERYPTAEALRADLGHLLETCFAPCTSREISGYMQALFGEARASERLRILRSTEQGPPPEGRTEVLDGADASPTAIARPPRRRRSWPWILAATSLAAAFLGVWHLSSNAPWLTEEGAAPQARPVGPIPTPETTLAAEAPEAPEPKAQAPRPPVATERSEGRALQAEKGWLRVEANVPVEISLNGKRFGPAPRRLELSSGRHSLRLSNDGLHLLRSAVVTVKRGQETAYRADFQKTTLNVVSTPWSEVWLDGVMIGQTPIAGQPIWEGTHVVRLVSPSGEKTVRFRAKPGALAVVNERLP